MRGISILAGVAAAMLTCSLATATNNMDSRTSAADNYLGALLTVRDRSDQMLDAGVQHRANGSPFMVANAGRAATFVIGCEDNCNSIHLRVRAAGLPDFVAQGGGDGAHNLIATIPATYARSLSNFEVDIDANCGAREVCETRWGLVPAGPPSSLTARGMPTPPTAAELSAATAGGVRWTARPSGDDLRYFYPVAAWRRGSAGSAQLDCLVASGGALRCRAAQETPARAGFGEAAERLSTTFRVAETDEAGQSTLNRRVSLPVNFAQPN